MKRSEALDKIANIIHEYRRSTQVFTSDDIAGYVLSELEQLGMKPPLSLIDTGSLEIVGQMWEPEND